MVLAREGLANGGLREAGSGGAVPPAGMAARASPRALDWLPVTVERTWMGRDAQGNVMSGPVELTDTSFAGISRQAMALAKARGCATYSLSGYSPA